MNLALDASARTIDTDGRLHIAKSHISKAMVCPYYGKEIPGYQALGLDPQKVYYLYRAAEALAAGAETFARLPILKKHIPVTAEAPRQDLIVGAIGSDVAFDAPYLDADICIWEAKAIAGIETDTVKELSCAYHYVPVMTSGTYEGVHYDGIMTEIRGNHLALVESGRAGSDVVAADSNPFAKEKLMKMTKLGKALFVAFGAASKKLAQDSGLPALVGEVTKQTLDKAKIKTAILAMDSELKPQTIDVVMDALEDLEKDPEPKENKSKEGGVGDEGEETEEETEEEKKKRLEKEKAEKDKDTEAKDVDMFMGPEGYIHPIRGTKGYSKKKTTDAMPEKLEHAMDEFKRELREADEARRAVRPVVGDVIAQDSAEGIYSFALDHLKVDHKDVTGVPALKALFTVAAGKSSAAPPKIAQDSAGLTKQFPNAARFRQA